MFFQRVADFARVLGPDLSGTAARNWQKAFDALLPLQANDLDRIEHFWRTFAVDTTEGRRWLRETLEGIDSTPPPAILDSAPAQRGLKVGTRIQNVYPTLYHYADGNTMLNRATLQPDGTWLLHEHPTARYVGPANVNTIAESNALFQLPAGGGPTKGRFKCIIRTADIADDCRIPRSYRHENNINEWLNWLEPVCADNLTRGAGGGVQFVQRRAVKVDVIDLKTGLPIRTQTELDAAIANP